MWTRAELKERAKAGLKQYYWYGVLAIVVQGGVVFIISLLTGFIPFVGIILNLLVSIFVINVISVGLYSYFIKSTRSMNSAGIEEIFSGFRNDYQGVVTVQFFQALFIGLWSLLFVIPGIMKRYEYYMVSYLAAEYPEKDRKEIFQMSKSMMDGNKFDTWVLELSFIGWLLLGALVCGIGTLFVAPYIQATIAELYLKLKEERLGIPREVIAPWGSPAPLPLSGIPNLDVNKRGSDRIGIPVRTGVLTGMQGEFSGASIPIGSGGEVYIGTDPGRCNIVIQGAQVSMVHLKVAFNGSAFVVTDYSEMGTYDMQKGRLQKNVPVSVPSGTYLQIGTGGDIFCLECRGGTYA